MGELETLDPQDIFMSLGEIIIQEGIADGTFVEVEWDSDAFVDVVGSDGSVGRAKKNDGRATVKFTIMQTSPVNALLSSQLNLDINAPSGAGVAPLLIQNHRDGSEYFGAKAWVKKKPSIAYGNEVKMVDWEMRVAKFSFQLNGG